MHSIFVSKLFPFVFTFFSASLENPSKTPLGDNFAIIDNFQAESDPTTCTASFGTMNKSNADLNMLDIYDTISFPSADPAKGWQKEWKSSINNVFTAKNKLKVFIVPHSHCDPGWLKTYEEYYDQNVSQILDSMLKSLDINHDMKMIWAEVPFFSLWWDKLSVTMKELVKQVVALGQLEFVTGGWVQADEANTHYFALITQLREGHQWLYNHLKYIPKNGWSIDPFGHSPTMAYILRMSGLKQIVIQRTHYQIKRYLAERRDLEFIWRQEWDSDGHTDILCHMIPYQTYIVQHSCGPDPKICCTFDFGNKGMCYKPPVEPLRNESLLLLDQYRIKAQHFKTNALLVPHGQDYHWVDDKQWKASVDGYREIFRHINRDITQHANLKFGTLEDYFNAVNEDINSDRFKPSVLTGDFFTYADRDEDYWSGYYTSRPSYKGLDRDLINNLRSANILHSLICSELSSLKLLETVCENLLGHLIVARRHLSLFQHHDGITGTSKDYVMIDYGKKLYEGLIRTSLVMQQSIFILNNLKSQDLPTNKMLSTSIFYKEAYSREDFDQLPRYKVLKVGEHVPLQYITVFNSLPYQRTQLVNLHVNTNRIKVFDLSDETLEFDIFPVFVSRIISTNTYLLSILVNIGGLATKNLKIVYKPWRVPVPEIKINYKLQQSYLPYRTIQYLEKDEIFLENAHMKIKFNHEGFPQSLHILKTGVTHHFNIDMIWYPSHAGLYLFRPTGPSYRVGVSDSMIRMVKGRFQSYVEVELPQVTHRITLFNHSGLDQYSIQVTSKVDIRHVQNVELMMRISTGIQSKETFYTDLNGFQIIRRKFFRDKLPLQANYYPMTSAAYIEDDELRMTVLARQSQGVTLITPGSIELVLDRRPLDDDHRGVGQGSTDNRETLSNFKILFETFDCVDELASEKPPMLSLPSHLTLNMLQYPMQVFMRVNMNKFEQYSDKDYSSMGLSGAGGIPCDVQLLDLAAMPLLRDTDPEGFPTYYETYAVSNRTGLYLHRVGFDARLSRKLITECDTEPGMLGHVRVKNFLGSLFHDEIQQATLTLTKVTGKRKANDSILLSANEIYAFIVSYK